MRHHIRELPSANGWVVMMFVSANAQNTLAFGFVRIMTAETPLKSFLEGVPNNT